MRTIREGCLIAAISGLASCGGTGIADSVVRARTTSNFPTTWSSASGEVPGEAAATSAAPPRGDPPAPPPTFVRGTPQPASFALIVGVDHYRDVIAAPGARNDAERFGQIARHTLGIPEAHVHLALDDRATKTDLESELTWLTSSATSGGRIYFFFSGHGAPDTASASGTPFLVPYDGNPNSLGGTALPLSTVMARLGTSLAKDVLVLIDSCFSGAGGRSVMPPGARPLVRVKEQAPGPQIALFTASGPSEISGVANDAPLGLFTKYVTEGLGSARADADGDGIVSLAELADYVRPRVERDAKREHRDQSPSVSVGSGIGDPKNFEVAWGFAVK